MKKAASIVASAFKASASRLRRATGRSPARLVLTVAVVLSLAAVVLFLRTKTAEAAITQPLAWTKAYDQASATGNTTSFAIANGSNRLLVVGIAVANTSSNAPPDPSTVTYGGVALTQATTNSATSARMHTWLYFLKDDAVMDNTSRTLDVTFTGATIVNMTVWYAVYAGVAQSPGTYTTGNNIINASGSGPAQLSAAMAVNANEQAVYISSIYDDAATTIPGYTINANWTSGGNNTGTSGTTAWKVEVAKRTIPVSNTTDSATTSAITPAGQIRYAMSAMSLPPAATTVGDGTAPSNKTVYASTTNNAVSAFTLVTNGNTDTVTGLVVTGTNTANVASSGVKIYKDNGSTPNEWDSGDALVTSGTASFSGTTATFSGLSIPVDGTVTQYLITYDISATPTPGQTLMAVVTSVTATNPVTNNDTTDATLTIGTTYYSQNSGAPNTTTNWNSNRAGGGSTPANFTGGNRFVIQGTGGGSGAPHSMTTSATWTVSGANSEVVVENGASLSVANTTTVDRLTIPSGGTVSVTGAVTLTVNNGNALGADLSVAGTLSLTNAASAFAFVGGTGEFLSGGKFTLARNGGGGGVVPTAVWDANSTLEITGITSTVPTGLGQSFGNVIWNCAGQTVSSAVANALTIQGDLNLQNTGTGALHLPNDTANTVAGNYIQSGGTFQLGNNGTHTLTVGGSFTLSGGTYANLGDNAPGQVLSVAGDFSITGGTFDGGAAGPGLLSVVFNGGVTQTFKSGATVSNAVNYTVNSPTTLQMDVAATVVSGTTFTLSSGATLGIRSTAGITSAGATGNVQTTTRTFNAAANYTYNGTAAQVTGNGLPTTITGNLTIANSAGVTLSANETVNTPGTCLVNSGALLTLGPAIVVNGTGTFTLSSGGSLQIGSTAGITSAGATGNVQTTTRNFNTGGNYTYNGAANQAVGNGLPATVNNLTIANTGGAGANTVTLAQSTVISTALSVSAGTFDQGATFNLSIPTTTVSSGATWQNLGTGDFTVGTGGVTNNGIINFNANGTACGGNDDIVITSSSTGVQRTWSGTGTFSMTDVNVKDQTVPGTPNPPLAILVNSGTDSGNNTGWVFVVQCTAGTYTWIGGTVGAATDWTVPTNWSPTRTTPATTDTLFFDGSATPSPNVTNVPTQTNKAIRLINSINGVTLNASGSVTLTLSGGTGTDLSIASGSVLTLNGANAITISLTAAGSQGSITGQMIVQGGAHRLLGSNASEITFNSGAIFTTTTGFTGNAFGTTTAGSVVFANLSHYVHGAGSSPFGTVGGTAVVTFQTGSEAQYLTATGFDANGRTYANLTVGNGTAALALSDSASTGNFQFDNLAINSTGSATSTLAFTGTGSSTVTIRGNITSVGAGAGSAADLTLSAGTGLIQINKPSGGTVTYGTTNNRSIDFESNAVVDSATTVNLGRIVQMGLTGTNILTANGPLVPNFSGTGFVAGGVRKTSVPASYTFPVGYVTGYTPVDFANATGGPGDITVMPKHAVQPSLNTSFSLGEYWTITLNSGTLTTDMVFHYLAADVVGHGTESNYQLIKVEAGDATNFPGSVNTVAKTATVTQIGNFSDWTLGEPAPKNPTAIKLTKFVATQDSNNRITLSWRTGQEAHNLGYYVYREQNGKRTRITPSIVAGSALVTGRDTVMRAGMSYTWYDQPSQAGATYWLEDIDLNGTHTMHGPIAPETFFEVNNTSGTSKQGTQARSQMLSELQKTRAPGVGSYFRQWPAAFANQQAALLKAPGNDHKGGGQNYDPDAPPGQGPALQGPVGGLDGIKIAVSQSGWQRVTQPELVAAGLDANVNAQKLQLYANGAQIPIRQSGNGVSLTASDYIEFYGHGIESTTESAQTYYLIVGKGQGSRVSDVPKTQALPPASGPSSFDYTVERKDKWVYYAALLNGDKENIFGHVVTTDPATETVPVSNPDAAAAASGAQAHLEVSLVGVSLEDHHVHVSVNGADVGTIDFTGGDNPSQTFALAAGLLHDGDNSVQFTAVGSDTDVSLIETVRLTYPHSYKADNNSLAIGVSNANTTRVNGFTSANIRVVDITNQSNMTELTQTASVALQPDGTYAVDIQVPAATSGNPHTLQVFVDGQSLHPDAVRHNDPSSWATVKLGSDYLIITSRDFKSSVQPLAELRRKQGFAVSVVDVEDLYDEFSFGAHTPQAIHDFLETAVNNWKRTPRYVLLAGDASYDPKNYLDQGSTDFVPTKLFDSVLMETASDDWLADFDGDGIADIAIGRLPMRTPADAALMVNKIISYESMAPDPQSNVVLVADNSFEGTSTALQTLVPSAIPVQVINRSSSDDGAVHTQIINDINQGPRLVNFAGHGSIGVWTGGPVLSSDDMASLTNTNRLSVFLMMTCLNGYFQDAYDDSLSEALMRTQGGAVAVWASTGMTEPPGQDSIDQELYRQLFSGARPALGDAVLAAKHATTDNDVRRTWVFFGDPAMRLRDSATSSPKTKGSSNAPAVSPEGTGPSASPITQPGIRKQSPGDRAFRLP